PAATSGESIEAAASFAKRRRSIMAASPMKVDDSSGNANLPCAPSKQGKYPIASTVHRANARSDGLDSSWPGLSWLVPAIHVMLAARKAWMPGTSPGTTEDGWFNFTVNRFNETNGDGPPDREERDARKTDKNRARLSGVRGLLREPGRAAGLRDR